MLAGCTGFQLKLPDLSALTTGSTECQEQSPECLQQRAAKLRAMTNDRTHAWVQQPEPLAAYANGTRLFAYRMSKRKLKCEQLGRGVAELQQAGAAYGNPVGSVVLAQAARTKALIEEVRGELGAEMRRRCKNKRAG
jgi:hypothetical protein